MKFDGISGAIGASGNRTAQARARAAGADAGRGRGGTAHRGLLWEPHVLLRAVDRLKAHDHIRGRHAIRFLNHLVNLLLKNLRNNLFWAKPFRAKPLSI